MAGFSINTNVGAYAALQTLNATNKSLETTQNRINTGLKVASTKDDSGTYAIAQSLRADLGGLNAVKSSLDRAQSTLDVAISAAESITDVLVMMKEKATAAADAGLDQDSRDALVKDFNKLADQIATYINNAEFNGTNILKGTDELSAIVNPNLSGTTFQTIKVENLNLAGSGAVLENFVALDGDGNAKGLDTPATWATAAEAATSVGHVDAAITALKDKLSEMGSAYRQIEAQQVFTTKLADTVEAGIGNLVDADLAKESANLQALQIKQQLGLQALSIANQAPQTILSLFR